MLDPIAGAGLAQVLPEQPYEEKARDYSGANLYNDRWEPYSQHVTDLETGYYGAYVEAMKSAPGGRIPPQKQIELTRRKGEAASVAKSTMELKTLYNDVLKQTNNPNNALKINREETLRNIEYLREPHKHAVDNDNLEEYQMLGPVAYAQKHIANKSLTVPIFSAPQYVAKNYKQMLTDLTKKVTEIDGNIATITQDRYVERLLPDLQQQLMRYYVVDPSFSMSVDASLKEGQSSSEYIEELAKSYVIDRYQTYTSKRAAYKPTKSEGGGGGGGGGGMDPIASGNIYFPTKDGKYTELESPRVVAYNEGKKTDMVVTGAYFYNPSTKSLQKVASPTVKEGIAQQALVIVSPSGSPVYTKGGSATINGQKKSVAELLQMGYQYTPMIVLTAKDQYGSGSQVYYIKPTSKSEVDKSKAQWTQDQKNLSQLHDAASELNNLHNTIQEDFN